MPQTTYTPIASVTLSASASEVVFSGLPQTYRDLILVANYGATTAQTSLSQIRFNGDSGNNYNDVFMSGNVDNSTSSGANSSVSSIRVLRNFYDSASLNQTSTIQIMDYSATDKQKTILIRTGSTSVGTGAATGGGVLATAARWANSASGVTSISFFTGNSFLSGSTFNLFGIVS